MFVHPMRRWAQGAVFSTVGALALIACDDPEQSTALRPEGAPTVLSVTVSNDPDGYVETATYCAPDDLKRPTFVALLGGNVCPDDPAEAVEPVTDAYAFNPYVRIQFDELLNADAVEELTRVLDPDTMEFTGQYTGSIAPRNPVSLMCNGVEVAYDGYYNPSGNSVTWPLGPSIVVYPVDPTTIPAGSSCTVSVRPEVVIDKQGERATDTQAFAFSISSIALDGSDPAPEADPADAATIAPDSPVTLFFNSFVDPASFAQSDILIETVADCTAAVGSGTAVPAIFGGGPGEVLVGTTGDSDSPQFAPSTTYLISFPAGAEVEDLAGATGELPPADEFTLCFSTDAA